MLQALWRWFKSFTHNAIVHPLMPCLPKKVAKYIHHKHALWAYKHIYDKKDYDTQ